MLVQIVKEPRGLKGARVSTNISLPGRYLVLMPTGRYSGVSSRIEDPKERARLKQIMRRVRPEGMATIVRTAAAGVSEAELIADLGVQLRLWHGILESYKRSTAPALLHKDLNLVFKAVRDFLTSDVTAVYIDSKEQYDEIRSTMSLLGPQYSIGSNSSMGKARSSSSAASMPSCRSCSSRRSRYRREAIWCSNNRSAHRHRRQHRQVHRWPQSGRHDRQDEHRGRCGDRTPSPLARYRRHYRRRLHRHVTRAQPRASHRDAHGSAAPRPHAQHDPELFRSSDSSNSRASASAKISPGSCVPIAHTAAASAT